MTAPGAPAPRSRLAWASAALLLLGVLPRTLGGWDPMPAWGVTPLDPTWIPPLSFTPGAIAAMDAVTILALLLAVLSEIGRGRSGGRSLLIGCGLFAVGAGAVLGHGTVRLEHAEVGGPWVGAVAAGLAAAWLGRDPAIRKVLLGVAIGSVLMVLAKGVWQVLIELPATRAAYEADPLAYIRSQGWAPDSAQVRGYERRLAGSEATGWFGLSNVFATFAAAALAAGSAMLGNAFTRSRGLPELVAGASAATAGLVGLWLSQSTAGAVVGVVAALLGLAGGLFGTTIQDHLCPAGTRRAGALWLVGPLLLTGLLAAIAARGIVGTSVGELSVLFRWFYISTAVEIFGADPLTGVGPGGFRDAYILAKPPIAPEDVTSPHSVLFDWLATLGVGALAWWSLLLVGAARAGRTLLVAHHRSHGDEPEPIRPAAVLLLVMACALPGLFLQRAMLTPGYAGVLIVGLGAWAAFALLVTLVRGETTVRLIEAGSAGAAIAVALHTQFDVTAIWAVGAPLAGLLVGLGASSIPTAETTGHAEPTQRTDQEVSESRTHPAGRPIAPWVGAGLVALVLGWFAALPALSLARWDLTLREAAAPVLQIRDVEDDLALAGRPGVPSAERDRALARVRDAFVASGSDEPMDERGYAVWRAGQLMRALDVLERGVALRPGHVPTSRSYATLAMALAETHDRAGSPGPADAARQRTLDGALALTDASPGRSAAWGWRGVVARELWSRTGNDDLLVDAIVSRETAADLDPHGLVHPLALVDLYESAGNPEARREAAARALTINDRLALDPAVQLTEQQVERLRAIVDRDADAPPPPGP